MNSFVGSSRLCFRTYCAFVNSTLTALPFVTRIVPLVETLETVYSCHYHGVG